MLCAKREPKGPLSGTLEVLFQSRVPCFERRVPMTPLRTRMIRELELRRKVPGTLSRYVKAVEDLPGSMPRTTGDDGAGTCRGENGCRLDPRPDRRRHHPLPPLRRTAGSRRAFASAIAIALSSAGPQLLGHLMTSILQHAVSLDQPCSVARSRMVCAGREQTATASGDSPFFGRRTPQLFPANRLPAHGVLPSDDDRSHTIPK